MQYSKQSCKDLAFLVPLSLRESDLGMVVPFCIYCNPQNNAEHSAMYLQSQVHSLLKEKILWVHVHSGMSDKHKQKAVKMFKSGKLIGITAMESLGLVCTILSCNIYTEFK